VGIVLKTKDTEMGGGMFTKSEVGVAQGEPISLLLANIMLNELDQNLDR
jgi:retron-type reverse transcriptase